jgi:hypothetical protein
MLAAGRGVVRAQSLTNGALRGVALYATESTPIVGVQITVEGSDGRAISFLETDGSGLFTVPLLPPGTYRVLAEQVGLQPVRLTGVVIEAGQTTSISFRLQRKPPPVDRVIEIPQRGATAGATMGRTVAGTQLSDGDRNRPSTDIARDITEVVRTGDARDAWALSTGGLAATSSRLWVDGLPENLTRHPSLTGEPASAPLFQRDALSQIQVQSIGFDSEWRGYPGSLLAGHTQRGTNLLSFRPYATFSNASLGSVKEDNPADSTATSFQVGASLAGPIIRDTANFMLRLDYQQVRTPSAYPWENDAALLNGSSVSLREALPTVAQDTYGVGLNSAVQPVVRTWNGISGMGRLDWRLGRHTAMLRFGYAKWTEDSPLLLDERANLNDTELDAKDLSGAVSITSSWPGFSNEIRLGFANSTRDWTTGLLPSTSLVAEDISFGGSGALPGLFDVKSFDVSDVIQFRISRHRFKAGINYTMTDYRQNYRYGANGIYTFGSLDDFAQGQGTFYQSVVGATDEVTPRIAEGGLFLQDTWTASPEIALSLGIRYDLQTLPEDEITLNQDWLLLSGRRNDYAPYDNHGWGPRFGLVWDVQNRGEWIVRGGAGLYFSGLDPALFSEAILFDGGVSVLRGQGQFSEWPSQPSAEQAANVGARLTLFNDSWRDPRTFKAGMGLSHVFSRGTTLQANLAYHHTDYLARRTDLNLNPIALAQTQEGRPVYGTLVQQGGLISASPQSNRRFTDFDLVSGLASTGFSDYYELSFLLERQLTRGLSFAASYTFSKTEDNVPGQRTLDPTDQINPFPEGLNGADWTEGKSDFDVPHRIALSGAYKVGDKTPISVGARWRYRSGLPFTPGFRQGVDPNGDGAGGNDPAYLDAAITGISEVLSAAGCSGGTNAFAVRNSCREDAATSLDFRFSVGLPLIAKDGSRLSVVLDAFNVVSSTVGLVDRALVLVDPNGAIITDNQGNVTLPFVVNPNFGNIQSRRNDPRLIRVGVRMEY